MTKRRSPKKSPKSVAPASEAGAAAGARSRRSWIGALVVVAGLIALAVVFVPRLRAPSAPVATGPVAARLAGEDRSRWSPVKAEFAAVAARLESGSNPYLGRGQVAELEAMLGRGGLNLQMETTLKFQLWHHQLRLGNVAGATETIESIFRQVAVVPNLTTEQLRVLHWTRALTYLRAGEVQNCVQRPNADCCILPLKGGGVHAYRQPAEEAQKSLLALLENEPDSLNFQWLLNITSMAVGKYPGGVPARFRIPESAFESAQDVGRFRDIAPQLGVDSFSLCGGAIAEDFDNDGFLDVVTSSYDPAFPLTFYRNKGDGTFEDLSQRSHLDDQLGGLNCLHADYDNDGDADILILRGAWLLDDGRIRMSLVRNNGNRTFTDVTKETGLAVRAQPTQCAAWLDYDNDGDLDLYVGAESRLEVTGDGDYPCQLYRNDKGKFTDVADAAGVRNNRYCKGVAAGDYDNDGDMDLYVSNMGPNRLYRNNSDGTFTDVAPALGMEKPLGSFASWFFDYDNDGWLDLWVGGFDASIADVAADYLGRPHKGTSPCFYRNQGDGTFKDIARELGLAHPYTPMGANFGDIDNDGFLDIYLATGRPGYEFLVPNIMLRNDGARRYVDVTTSGGFGHVQKGHGVAFADFDNDGDQDIYEQLGGFYPGDAFRNVLFENPGHGNRSVVIRLIGTRSNRDAVGARIHLAVEGPGGPRSIHRAVGSVSSFGGSPRRQEIGLADATRIAEVRVFWPVSRTTQIVRDVPLGASIEITEGKEGFKRLEHRAVRFADARVTRN